MFIDKARPVMSGLFVVLKVLLLLFCAASRIVLHSQNCLSGEIDILNQD